MAKHVSFYPNPNAVPGMEVVELDNTPEDIAYYAPLIQAVLLVAYQRRFEQRQRSVPKGTIAKTMANPADLALVQRQAQRMKSHMDGGSRYVAVHLGSARVLGGMVALGKSTPSRPRVNGQRVALEDANCFVNDLVSGQPGKGAGKVALHTLLKPYRNDREVILDAYGRPNDIELENEWFRSLGLMPSGEVQSPVVLGGRRVPLLGVTLGGQRLPQFRMGRATVGQVRTVLTASAPWLADATHYSSPQNT